MTKTTETYWSTLHCDNKGRWHSIEGMKDMAEELTLSIDVETGCVVLEVSFPNEMIKT